MFDLVFWMNMPSFYQADFFRALLRTGKVNLKAIFTNRIPEDRVRLGWQDDLANYEHEFLDERHPLRDSISKALSHRHDINIVSGLWAGKVTETVLMSLLLSHSKYFIYSEAPDARDTVPPLKLKLTRAFGKPIVRHSVGLLPISHFAYDYFRSYGADGSKLHPFAYFRKSSAFTSVSNAARNKTTVDTVYVGQLVHRKGLDILLKAMEPLFAIHRQLNLQLIGTGEMRSELEEWAGVRNLTGRIRFEGTLNPRQITERISKADILALPSRWDGWGLVVNEALMAGVPVIVSDMCGAADVVRDGTNGYVFRSGCAESLRTKLEEFLKCGRREDESHDSSRSREAMAAAAKETGAGLDPDNAAEYLLRVIKGEVIGSDQIPRYPWVVGRV